MKKLLFFCLVGLLALSGCSKDDEATPAASAVMYDGQPMPIAGATYWTSGSLYTEDVREFRFSDADGKLNLKIRAQYAEAGQFGTGTFLLNKTNETPDFNWYFGSLYYDANRDGSIAGADEYSTGITDGTFELIEYSPEKEFIKATFNFTLENGKTITGTYAGYYSENIQ